MSGKSRGHYRSVGSHRDGSARAAAGIEGRRIRDETGESRGRPRKLYSFVVDEGLSIRRMVCPLFVVERYSYEESGRRANIVFELTERSRQDNYNYYIIIIIIFFF